MNDFNGARRLADAIDEWYDVHGVRFVQGRDLGDENDYSRPTNTRIGQLEATQRLLSGLRALIADRPVAEPGDTPWAICGDLFVTHDGLVHAESVDAAIASMKSYMQRHEFRQTAQSSTVIVEPTLMPGALVKMLTVRVYGAVRRGATP